MGGVYRIFLNQNQTKQQIWQDFSRESTQILSDEGYQTLMHNSFREYQVWQADSPAYHFSLPPFKSNGVGLSRNEYEVIELITAIFNVEDSFTDEKIRMWLQIRDSYLFFKKISSLAN